MKDNTKVRLRLSKQLFESLSKQIIAEAKANDGYTVAVKQPKMPKQSKAQAASPEVQKTDKEVTMEMSSKEKMAKGLYKEAGKESVKKVMADITALSKEDQAKIKKFISSRSKKSIKEDEGSSKVHGGTGQNQGDSGSSLEFTIAKKGPDYFDIDYTIIPNSKHRQSGAGSRSPREKQYGSTRIMKDDIKNGYITVKGDSYQIGKDFVNQSLNEYEHHYEMVNGQCRRYNDEGDYEVVAHHYCR
jgi:hypothetical protein